MTLLLLIFLYIIFLICIKKLFVCLNFESKIKDYFISLRNISKYQSSNTSLNNLLNEISYSGIKLLLSTLLLIGPYFIIYLLANSIIISNWMSLFIPFLIFLPLFNSKSLNKKD